MSDAAQTLTHRGLRSGMDTASSPLRVVTPAPNKAAFEPDAESPQIPKKEELDGLAEDKAAVKKRPRRKRKVHHACVYCRRSHMTCDQRPCTRCIKRDIGLLCHDEPREARKSKRGTDGNPSTGTPPLVKDEHAHGPAPNTSSGIPKEVDSSAGLTSSALSQPHRDNLPFDDLKDRPKAPSTGDRRSNWGYDEHPSSSYNPSQFQDMHNFHPNYLFHTSEVTNEFNLLNDFLSASLVDDQALYPGEEHQYPPTDPSLLKTMASIPTSKQSHATGGIPATQIGTNPTGSRDGTSAAAKAGTRSDDKLQEKYYMTAADPAGTDNPEGRMKSLLEAKYQAGLLKPFNYVNGYKRLNQYMEDHMHSGSKQRILRQLEKFRPKFRERMQSLSDYELVMVEMWFERKLMEYDRVFASMAIPACCWRRTGEIFRGNRALAELIHVPVEHLRDGKLAIHEIFSEDSLVQYWELFGNIAFDKTRKAMLTSCSLKNPDPTSKDHMLKCCFSFTVQRDTYTIPSLIIGNFLPTLP